MSSLGKGWGVMMMFLKKWPSIQHSDWYKKKIGVLVSCWYKVLEVDGDYVERLVVNYIHLVIL
jgi:hypothetical protein